MLDGGDAPGALSDFRALPAEEPDSEDALPARALALSGDAGARRRGKKR